MRTRTLHTIIACATLGALLAPAPSFAEPAPEQAITEQNWEQHPKIVEVRKLYEEIQAMLKQKKLKVQDRNFLKAIAACDRVLYPIEFVRIAADKTGRARLFVYGRRISDNALLTTWEYYDEGGRLRFVDRTNQLPGFVPIEDRIYLTEQGRAFWDVTTEGKKTTFGEETREHLEADHFSLTSQEAMNGFQGQEVECDK